MRPSYYFLLLFAALCSFNMMLAINNGTALKNARGQTEQLALFASKLGSADLVLATEARYTRHLSVTDGVVPFMDHPGSLEHFPSGSLWRPPEMR